MVGRSPTWGTDVHRPSYDASRQPGARATCSAPNRAHPTKGVISATFVGQIKPIDLSRGPCSARGQLGVVRGIGWWVGPWHAACTPSQDDVFRVLYASRGPHRAALLGGDTQFLYRTCAGGRELRNLLLRSLLVALIAIPFIAAYDPNPRRGLKKAVAMFAGFCFFYMLALGLLYARLPS